MKILLTGFNRFGNYTYNPTEVLIEKISSINDEFYQRKIYTKILKTEYKESEREIIELIERIKPDKIILTGVSEADAKIKIELIAKNNCSCSIPDNKGFIPKKNRIELNGSNKYKSSIQLEVIKQKLTEYSIPFCLSNNAGDYICNFVYYRVLHHIKKNMLPIGCMFLHIPFFSDFDKNNIYSNGLPKDNIYKALDIIINALLKESTTYNKEPR